MDNLKPFIMSMLPALAAVIVGGMLLSKLTKKSRY